jgi:hypothetical protein
MICPPSTLELTRHYTWQLTDTNARLKLWIMIDDSDQVTLVLSGAFNNRFSPFEVVNPSLGLHLESLPALFSDDPFMPLFIKVYQQKTIEENDDCL